MMSINQAILGLLSYKPLTGYELKKIMQDSPFMYWSGNNNQIYKVLLSLHDDGYVTSETIHQDSSPSKKVYTITDAGLGKLKRWVLGLPEAPEIKNSFLIQLAWTAQLDNNEIRQLLTQYEQEVKGRLAMEQNKIEHDCLMPGRTPREAAIWELLYENILSSYRLELEWVDKVRQSLSRFNDADYETRADDIVTIKEEAKEMEYTIVEKNGQKYIKLDREGLLIQKEQDALTLLTLCMENGTNLLLIQGERLSDEFLRLKTGIAGAILQKFVQYNIKTVAVLDKDKARGKFKEFLAESNRGSMFRTYANFDEAEQWLLNNN